ncbi:MAG: sulfatase-like hydrolase/transferase [Gammaproteobacteria bacterium]|nr:sulfatase-like hydrolase/transferase [Gammaproteobacteria bacterium]
MVEQPNILFVMADQLRADYLGCYGHAAMQTPNIDALAGRGVTFTRAYVQSPVCGGSRMCFYTGRYAATHGAHYNNYPLRVDELTIGDYLRPLGYRVGLVGKTHMQADLVTFARLGIEQQSPSGELISQCGFEPFERDDGLHPTQSLDENLAYNSYLRELGYNEVNPWHDVANSALGEDGELLSGWHMRNAAKPARVAEPHSETAYMTDRAMEFIRACHGQPWCLHLSYIKPHWPYMAPDPYHAMYSGADVQNANRSEAERRDPNPVFAAFMQHDESVQFARDEVRATVIPTYMGLISQIDHHLGRLLTFLRDQGLADNTVVIFTSDHGDYLGDHWLAEKDLYHEEIARIPLIVCDPRAGVMPLRGSTVDALVESIDLLPTMLDWAGGTPPTERLEGRSLSALLSGGGAGDWRDAVFADGCFGLRKARLTLGLAPHEARSYMVRTERWKYIRFEKHPPLLFDLEHDAHERRDLGRSGQLQEVRRRLDERMFDWLRRRRLRITYGDDRIEELTGKARERGYHFGVW